MPFTSKVTSLVIGTFSVILSSVVCQFKGDVWEESIRNALYKVTQDTIPDYAKESVDEKGIPFVYYREQNGITAGNQYNPTIVCNYALDYYKAIQETKNHSAARRKFLNCVDWLANNITIRENYGLYLFSWQQPWYPAVSAPYTSGMTSGRAIEVFSYAHKLTRSPTYLQHARLLLRGFFVPIQSGGFTYKEQHGWWYEEIAGKGPSTPRILDGHIFAFLGVREYWLITKEDSANLIIQKGIEALKNSLPSYDAGNGKIYYDAYHKVADKKYHRILTRQMKQLAEITNDETFNRYHNKWNDPLKKPYVLRVFKEKNISGILLFFLVAFLLIIILVIIRRIINGKVHYT